MFTILHVGVEWSVNQLLNSVIDFEEKNACDLAIISILEYEVSVTRNDTYCDKTALMEDESFKIFIDTVYYVSPRKYPLLLNIFILL